MFQVFSTLTRCSSPAVTTVESLSIVCRTLSWPARIVSCANLNPEMCKGRTVNEHSEDRVYSACEPQHMGPSSAFDSSPYSIIKYVKMWQRIFLFFAPHMLFPKINKNGTEIKQKTAQAQRRAWNYNHGGEPLDGGEPREPRRSPPRILTREQKVTGINWGRGPAVHTDWPNRPANITNATKPHERRLTLSVACEAMLPGNPGS